LKNQFLLILMLLFVITFSEVSAQWAVWDCSTLPENTEMNGVLFTKGDDTDGLTDVPESVITSVIADPDDSENSLIAINEFDGDKKESWRNDWAIADPSVGVTAVFRARASDEVIALAKNEEDTFEYWYISLRDGQSRIDLELDYPNVMNSKGEVDNSIQIENPEAWHVIRLTMKGGAVKVYIDENPTPAFDMFAEAYDKNYMKYGETSTGGLYGGYLDWLIWDVSGAYAPGEGTPIPGELTGVTSVKEFNSELATTYTLSQNYPNPFNPTTNISFSLVESGYTTLKVYNAIGQMVSELIGEELSVGTYTYSFDAANLPSGIYFYSITSGEFSQTKKMILIK